MSSPRLLIVEDQADIRELIRLTLDLEEFEIDEAANGEQGWALAERLKPRLVLLDVMMPGSMDGFEVCRRIKANAALRHTKVLMLTARGQDSDRAEGQRAGADGYLTKPFSPKQLLEKVSWLTA
jgi:two-component system phosphate regulon response regulator PhoB